MGRNQKTIAKKHQTTVAQIALNWLVSFNQNVFVIPGATNKKQCQDNVNSMKIKLSDEEIEKLNYISKKYL